MGRFGFFIGIIGAVVALAVFGWRASIVADATQSLQSGATAAKKSVVGVIDQAKETAAKARAGAAATALEALRAERGEAVSVTTQELRAFDPSLVDASVVVVRATAASYCVQASYGSAVAHSTGPGQVASGPCS